MKRLFLLLLVLLSQWVFAQGPADVPGGLNFTVPDTDVSVSLLGNIFGVVDGVLHGTGSQIVGVMFKVFNSAVMALGITILGYTTVVGVVKTASEGEPLGKNWSSIFIPLRAAGGMALLIPKASGYCAFQIFVMWIVVQGVGAADAVWQSALSYLASGGIIVQQSSTLASIVDSDQKLQNDVVKAASAILTSQVCMYGLNQEMQNYYKASTDQNSLGQPPMFISPNVTTDAIVDATGAKKVYFPNSIDSKAYPNYAKLNVGPASPSGGDAKSGVCGSIGWPAIDLSGGPSLSGLSDAQKQQIQDQVKSSKDTAVQQMILDLDPIAQEIVNNYYGAKVPLGMMTNVNGNTIWTGTAQGGPLMTGSEIYNSIQDYLNFMIPALNYLASEGSNLSMGFIQDAVKDGWILAGSYYFNLVAINNSVSSDNKNIIDIPSASASGPPTSFIEPDQSGNPAAVKAIQAVLGSTPQSISPQVKDLDNLVNGISPITPGPLSKFQDTTTYLGAANAYGATLTYGNKGSSAQIPGLDSLSGIVQGALSGVLTVSGIVQGALSGVLTVIFPFIMPFINIIKAIIGLAMAQQSNSNPVVLIAQLGNSVLDLVMEIWILGAVAFAGVAAGLAAIPCFNFSNPVNTLATWLIPFLTFISATLFVTGATMAFYVPMIPYIIFTFAAIGWMIGVIEAMAAAPLVAIGIAHPEGHEILGKSEPAVMLLANVFLRPMLMLFGLITGIILSYVSIWLLNDGFARAMQATVLGITSFTAIIYIPVAWLVIYVTMVITILNKVFSLIHVIPDKVLRWLQGGLQESLGAEAAGAADQVKGGYQAAMQAKGEATSKAVQEASQAKAKRDQATTVTPGSKSSDGGDIKKLPPGGKP